MARLSAGCGNRSGRNLNGGSQNWLRARTALFNAALYVLPSHTFEPGGVIVPYLNGNLVHLHARQSSPPGYFRCCSRPLGVYAAAATPALGGRSGGGGSVRDKTFPGYVGRGQQHFAEYSRQQCFLSKSLRFRRKRQNSLVLSKFVQHNNDEHFPL